MKKIILTYGLISGLIASIWMFFISTLSTDKMMELGMVIGFATMIVAFSFIFIAITQFRNKYNMGVISFGKAFQIGALISLIASTIYVLTWMIDYQFYVPDFYEKYTTAVIEKMKQAGATQAKLDETLKTMQNEGELYKNNPLYRAGVTYMEILPLGLVISLIAAAILKRKKKKDEAVDTIAIR